MILKSMCILSSQYLYLFVLVFICKSHICVTSLLIVTYYYNIIVFQLCAMNKNVLQ